MKNVGVWIDQKEANIITLANEDAIKTKTIYSDVETRVRIEGEKKQFGRFGDQYLVDEKGKKNRIEQHTMRYLNKVRDELRSADQIMVFGPAQTKKRLEKLMFEDPNLVQKLKEIKASDNMTDNQKIAYVKAYFKEN
ncbi:MAG: hypothetical protein WBV45_08275 [Lutimonas sp.]